MNTRKFLTGFRTALIVAGWAFAATVHSQVWPVRAMLERTSSQVIQLKDRNGATTEKISRAWIQRVSDVSDRMAAAYGLPVPTLFIQKDNGINAFVTRGKTGPVMVMSIDMLKLVGDNNDLMAAVVGHELGHLKADHLTKGATAQAVVSLIGTFAGLLLDLDQAKKGVDTQGLGVQLGSAGSDLVNAKFSRDQEREADDLGIRNMMIAGFDPNASSKLWRLMDARAGGGSGLWLSTHPSHEERHQAMQALASSLKPIYASAESSNPSTRPALSKQLLAQYDDPYPAVIHKSFEPTDAEKRLQTPNAYLRGFTAHREKRYEDAFAAFREAADTGDGRALSILGDYAQMGRAQTVDLAKSKEYYAASANKGFSYGIFSLGQMALEGKGGTKDTAEAARLLTIAHNRNVPRASAFLGLMYSRGDYVERNLGTARQLMEKSADAGDVVGRTFLAVALRDGIGSPPDQSRSFSMLKLAAEANYPFANYQLGLSYEKGAGTEPNRDKAIAAYKLAASAGNSAAIQRLKALGQ